MQLPSISPDDVAAEVEQSVTVTLVAQPQTKRIAVIDTIRGVALLGILLININFFALPFWMGSNINVRNETGINYYIVWINNLGFEGTMRALFSMLFGASSILLLTKLEKKKVIHLLQMFIIAGLFG